jgi:TonB family protein
VPVCITCSREIPAAAPFCSWCGSANPEAAPPEDVAALADGERLRRRLQAAIGPDFTIEEELGEGGFAVVFAATDRKLSRRIAIKVLRPELVASRASRQRFVREAEASARLNHPHILPIFFVGEGQNLVWFGMPLVDGETLETRARREVRLDPIEVARIGAEVADALAEAHAAGLVHRDIKPLNVMLQGARGRILVADFGIAKAAAAGSSSGEKLTGTGIAIGSPHYMSPEQAAGEEKVDHRSDLYSLGIVLWQLLAGELPFEAAASQAVLMSQVTRAVPPIRTKRPDTPPALAAVVDRCTRKDPTERFQSAEELAEALRFISQTPQGLLAARRPARWVAVAASLATLALVGVIAWRFAAGNGDDALAGAGLADAAPAAPAAPASAAPVIAVLPFTVVTGGDTAQFGRAAALMLSEALALRNGVATVDANQLIGRWIEQGRRVSAPLDSNARFAYALGANQMIVGNYLESGGTFRLSVVMYDTHDATVLWRGEATGRSDSLFALLDRVANEAAEALCAQPAYNPSNLCYDRAARPARPLAVAADSADVPLHFLARVRADGTAQDVRIAQASGDQALTARALEAVAMARYEPARRGGRPVDAWIEVVVEVRPRAAGAMVALAARCADPAFGARNTGRSCYDSRPVPEGRLPQIAAPAACRGTPQPATILVRVSAAGAVEGAPTVQAPSDCAAFTQAATTLAQDMTFTPAVKDGRPVAAWTFVLVRPAATGGAE